MEEKRRLRKEGGISRDKKKGRRLRYMKAAP
jgi:hypothetical protein